MERLQFRAMNTDINLAAEGDPARIAEGFKEARKFIEASEQRFTRFSEDSELSQLNRSAGSWFRASADMVFVVSLACQYSEQAGGLFNPSILHNLERIGYDRSLELIRAEESLASLNLSAMPPQLLAGVLINPDENLIFLPVGVSLDLGGIAKGWIAEQAAIILSETCQACLVDAGGDMYLVGLPEGEQAWQIGLEDPRQSGVLLTTLNIPPGALTTSSVARRTWKQGEFQRHHLIDPRTGEPAETDWLSVSVIAEHADISEVFSKALLIAGSQGAERLAQNAPEISFLAVDREGNLIGTKQSLEYIHGN
jgi:thiamine biosynthesis lipoprotein